MVHFRLIFGDICNTEDLLSDFGKFKFDLGNFKFDFGNFKLDFVKFEM